MTADDDGRRRGVSCAAGSRAEFRVVAAILLAACSTDTSGLVRREPTEQESGGAGGAGSPEAAAGLGGAGGAGPSMQPPADGTGSLSIVHGIVDGGNLFICLRDAATRVPLAGDVPQPLGGLPYARAHRIDLELLGSDVEVELVALSPSALNGASCTELASAIDASLVAVEAGDAGGDAAGPDASASGPPFPIEPLTPRRAGIVSIATDPIRAGAHDVLVAAGCATPSGVPTGAASEACGAPDTLFGSHQALPFVELGREASQPAPYLGLQFLNASRAIGVADVVLQGQNVSTGSVRLSNAVPFGALRPRAVTSVLEPVAAELHLAGGEGADYVQLWQEVVAESPEGAIEPAHAYALIYVGPLPSLPARAGFAPPRFVLVSSR